MPDILKQWEREFRKAAKADNLALFRNHLLKLGLPDEPESLLHGTILVVQACCVYLKLDSHSPAGFLALQKYNPAEVEDARYAFTFDLCGKAFARVLLSAKVGPIDLADLYGHPWWEYEVCGYYCFWVSRTDGADLSDDEIELIDKEVTEDLRFDYSEDELNFWFDDSVVEGALFVMLNDVYDPTGEDEELGRTSNLRREKMNPDSINELSNDLKAMVKQVLAVNQYDSAAITAIWAREITLQGAKGVVAITQFDSTQSVAVLKLPIVVMPVYRKILSLGDLMQLLTARPDIPSAQLALKDNILFFTLCLPLHSFNEVNVQAIFDSLLNGADTIRTDLLAAIRYFYDIKTPEEATYPEPVLPNIKLTPKEMQVIYSVLTRCNRQVQEIYTFLMEKWVKFGFFVETTASSIVLDIPYGNRTARLAVLLPGLSEGLAVLQPTGTAYPPAIILFWESLQKYQGFPVESIDIYQKTVKKITALHLTESSAHIDMGDQFDLKVARALLKAMKTLAQSVHPERIEEPTTSGPVTPDNIRLTLAACSDHVQATYRELVDGWKAAGGTVQSRKPGRIYLKMKTKSHRSGKFAQIPRNFNLAVLAAPYSKKPANLQIEWNLSRSESAAYLDCIPDEVARFEEVVTSLPGFERKGTITYLWMEEKFEPFHAKLLSNALIILRKAEQSAL